MKDDPHPPSKFERTVSWIAALIVMGALLYAYVRLLF
jgi:hypothetical protein